MRDTARINTSAGDIEAWVYEPKSPGKRPTVILGCGVGAVKAAGLHPFAQAFCQAGYLAVTFDYLSFGGSDGHPRHVVMVWDQYRDFQNVVRWAREHPRVDATRMVVWGTSFGGMHTTRLLADDPEIAAGIAQCPCVDAAAASRMKPLWKSAYLAALALWDLGRSYLGAEPLYVYAARTYDNDGVALMDAPDVPRGWQLLHRYIDQERDTGDPYFNLIAARSILSFPLSRPALTASRIKAPYLMVLPQSDSVAPLEAAERVAEMAPLGEIARVSGGHFDLYKDGIGFADNLKMQLEFLKRVVPVEDEIGM